MRDVQNRIMAAGSDFPSPLDELGILQTRSLTNQGADVHMGRKLSGLFFICRIG